MHIRDFVLCHQFCLNELTSEYGDWDKPRDQSPWGVQGNLKGCGKVSVAIVYCDGPRGGKTLLRK